MMRSLVLALALVVCGCNDANRELGDSGGPVDEPDPVTEVSPVDDTQLRGDELLSLLMPEDEGVDLPDFGRLAGSRVHDHEVGPWTLRTNGGGGSGRWGLSRRSTRGPSAPAGMLEAVGYADGIAYAEEDSMAPVTTVGTTAGLGGGHVVHQQPSSLRAGSTDDNAAFGAYLDYLGTWADRGMEGSYQVLDSRGRQYVHVTDVTGSPLPGARVRVAADGELIHSARTYGDGSAPIYPRMSGAGQPPQDGYVVEVDYRGERSYRLWDGQEPLQVTMDRVVPMDETVPVDVVFLVDTTGSMSDEIDRIKGTLLQVTDRLGGLDRAVDLRYGAVLYRDIGDEYVTKRHDFTTDLRGFDAALGGIRAAGGGDGPESLNQGLAEAVHNLEWRGNSAKVVFLVADAQPHMDYQGDVFYGDSARAAVDKGIKVHTVAASGLPDVGTLVFRQIAQVTQGHFVFIEYGSIEATAASHGVSGPVQSNNLDAILFQRIRAEVEGWRQPGPAVAMAR